MSKGHWRRDWGPPHVPHGDVDWRYRPGAEAWRGFARRMFIAMIFFFLFVSGLVWLLVFIASKLFSSWPAFLLLAPVVLFVFGSLVARSGWRTWRPVRSLIDAAGRLADGDYAARATPSGSAASRRVVDSFNEMAKRLETADEQRRQLLADLGHELRTPLTVIRGEIEAIVDEVHEPDPEHMQVLLDEVAVMERLLEDLRTLSMAEAGALALHPESVDLAALVGDAVDGYRRLADSQAVAISIAADDVGEVLVDPVRIREVIANLTVNALRAMPDGGALRVTVRQVDGEAMIRIKDTGIGIPAEDQGEVFERFRKGSTSAGSGLGLTISRDLVEAHGGSISIFSEVAVGTTVEVRLPIRRTE